MSDLISRQAVLDAMYELCSTGETLKENPWRDNPHIDAITDAIENLPTVTPQPYEDAISRQEVLEIIKFEEKWLLDAKSHNEDTKIAFSAIKSKISDLTSRNMMEE